MDQSVRDDGLSGVTRTGQLRTDNESTPHPATRTRSPTRREHPQGATTGTERSAHRPSPNHLTTGSRPHPVRAPPSRTAPHRPTPRTRHATPRPRTDHTGRAAAAEPNEGAKRPRQGEASSYGPTPAAGHRG